MWCIPEIITRKPRVGEENAKSYFFVSHEEFEQKIAEDGLLEYASYCGVWLAATAHGSDLEDLNRRPLYRTLMQTAVFRYVASVFPVL